ncbi:unnamed protein product [Cochlearia groenlandica]
MPQLCCLLSLNSQITHVCCIGHLNSQMPRLRFLARLTLECLGSAALLALLPQSLNLQMPRICCLKPELAIALVLLPFVT